MILLTDYRVRIYLFDIFLIFYVVDEEEDETQSETSEQTTPTMNTHLLTTHKKLSYRYQGVVNTINH